MIDIRCAHTTDTGLERQINQDCVAIALGDELRGASDALIVVADGMGGRSGGEIAARLTAQTLPDAVRSHLEASTEGGRRERLGDALYAGFTAANQAVWRRGKNEPGLQGMGTTCVAALARDGTAAIANAGDSRVYLLRDATMTLVTHDHVLIHDSGLEPLSPGEQPRSRFHKTITRAIGYASSVEPDITLIRLREGDRLLLCTDGLTNMVSDSEIERMLRSVADPQDACNLLVDAANRNGGIDNVTVAILQVGSYLPVIANEAEQPNVDEMSNTARSLPPRGRRSWRVFTLCALILLAGFAIYFFSNHGHL